MDDICLTRCEGTSFDEPTDLSVSGGMAVNEPSMALQGDYCRLLLSGKTLELSGPMLEPGLYTLSFFVKGPDAESAACAFPIDVAMSGEAMRLNSCWLISGKISRSPFLWKRPLSSPLPLAWKPHGSTL